MSNFGIAVKYALKDFFARQTDHSDFSKAWKNRRNYSYWSYDELCLVTVLAGMHKHTFGVPGSLLQAIRVGSWKYHDLKDIEKNAAKVFADTELSPEGQKLVLNMLRQGKGTQQFTREDNMVLTKIQNKADAKRELVNF
jgi:hypothetical protein